MSEGYSQHQVDALAKLWRRGLFGGKYQPIEQVLSATPREHHDKAKEALDELHKDGMIVYHKNRKCVSINTRYKEKVREILRGEIPGYILDLH